MTSLVDAIAQRTSGNPAAPALIGQQGSVTYEELLSLVIKIANFFDDRRLPRRACALVNIREPELRLAVTVAAIEYGLVPAIASAEVLRRDFPFEFTIGARALLEPSVPSDLVIDETVIGGRLADGRRRAFPQPADSDLAYVTETTGTTGLPKLLGISRAAHRAAWSRPPRHPLKPGDRTMFAMGSISRYGQNSAERALAAGAAVVAAPTEPVACLRTIALFDVVELRTTPHTAEKMLDAMERDRLRVPSVKHVDLVGSAFNPALLARIEAMFDADISVGYGTSEVGRISSGPVTSASYRRGYVGTLREGIRVLQAGTPEAPAPIVLAVDPDFITSSIAKGKVIDVDPTTVPVPDLGYVEDGVLYVTGRADEVFNYSGQKVAYETIRRAVEAVPGVRDVGIASAAPLGQEDLVVAVVADTRVDLPSLADRVLTEIDWLRARDRFHFVQVVALPRNPMGKIDRGELLRLYATGAGSTGPR